MGKRKKGFNWKAREQPKTVVDRSSETQVKVELEDQSVDKGYDDSNVLVLPSKKRETKLEFQQEKKTKRLTKKERKRLEKIIEQKKKKTKRADLLESLSAHKVDEEEMRQLTSISEVQTGKLKRKLDIIQDNEISVNAISGSGKKKRKMLAEVESESEESVHTSDMSSDEEELPGEVNLEECVEQGSPCDGTEQQDKEKCETTSKKCIAQNRTSDKKDEKRKNTSAGVNSTERHDGLHGDHIAKKITSSNKTARTSAKEIETDMKKVVNIPVSRTKDIQAGRLKLPILGEEQVIMESINDNAVTIICGETGSGKTTQVPQFLYEAGYAHGGKIIGVTEPRRVAAISMSNRVATEMALSNSVVSYQIRYEGNVTADTKMKFMTDGVLLKEVQMDFLLNKYSVIVIDEAHERSIYTDILIGLLSRIVPLRTKKGNPLKLVIMSATLRVEDFTENKRLFKLTPPVIKVDARQFPVTIHYNKRTPLDNYLQEAYRKTCKINRMLPEGGILIFVTGQQEVHTLCKRLKQTFPIDGSSTGSKVKPGSGKVQSKKNKSKKSDSGKSEKEAVKLPKINLDNYSVSPLDEEAEMEADDASDGEEEAIDYHGDDDDVDISVEDSGECAQPLYVLPLYSLLSSEKQAKVFGPVPDGYRLCVVATNVAETSLTIPGIRYVVDTGKTKTKFYDKVTGVSTFRVTWCSKAGADQRAGRAGRVGPGHCYRLFSSAVFNDEFEKFSPAEITRRPVDDLVLQMKDMNIEKVVNFPYPTPPDCEQIQAAETLLIGLGAVNKPRAPKSFKDTKKAVATSITPLGRAMACFPVSPRYGKMLALGHQHSLLPYVVAIVSALSVQELFVEVYSNTHDDEQKEKFRQKLIHMSAIKRRWAGEGHSLLLGDLMVMLKAVGSCEYAGCTPDFCDAHGIRMKAMKEVRKLRVQLTNAVNTVIADANIGVDPKMAPPDDVQAKLLRQIVLAGMGDHVARKLPDLPSTDPEAKNRKHAYQCPDLEDPVFIHPTSVLYRERPEYVVFQHIQETSKLYMKGVVAVESEWLPLFAPSHVTLSKPMEDPPPDFDEVKGQVVCHMNGTFGACSWPVPCSQLEFPAGLDRIKWFARFLLEGRVVPGLKQFIPDLLASPTIMVKSWAKLQPRTEVLLKELVSERVDCRDGLLKVWKSQPSYLLAAMKEWLPQSKHDQLMLAWPPR